MISVIITTYNRPDHLRSALLALSRQSVKFDEIVVADDGSDESTKRVVQDFAELFDAPVVHVWQRHDGFTAARSRNNAIRAARGDFLAFLDQDGLAHGDWLKLHLITTRAGTFSIGGLLMLDEKETSGITDREVLSGEFENIHSAKQRKDLVRLHRRGLFYQFLRMVGIGIKNKPRLNSGNFSVLRKDLEKVNGFDEDYVGWGQEDDDLGRRLYMAGVMPSPIIGIADVTHLWHPRDESAPSRWKDGRNIPRYRRRDIKLYCENGIRKPGGREDHDDVIVTSYNLR